MIVGTTLFITLNVWANPTSATTKKELKDICKQNSDKEIVVKVEDQQSDKTAKFESMGNDTTNALIFATNNVSTYYPDMKEHLDSLINHFRDQEQKDTVNLLFQQHIFKNITDPKEQVAAIIYCIETFVFGWDTQIKQSFTKKYSKLDIQRNNYIYLFDFSKWYNKRFKWYYKKLEKIIIEIKQKTEQMKQKTEQMKKEIKQMRKEIDGIINTFKTNDIKNNSEIKKLVLDTEQFYIEYNYEISLHLAELIQAAKQ